MLNSYLDLNFEDIKKADVSRYGNGKDIRLVNFGSIALFIKFELTTSSGKVLEDISHAHLVSLMYKLITSSKGSDDLSIGFNCSSARRQEEITNNKNVKGKFHLRIMLRDVLGFVNIKRKLLTDLDINQL